MKYRPCGERPNTIVSTSLHVVTRSCPCAAQNAVSPIDSGKRPGVPYRPLSSARCNRACCRRCSRRRYAGMFSRLRELCARRPIFICVNGCFFICVDYRCVILAGRADQTIVVTRPHPEAGAFLPTFSFHETFWVLRSIRVPAAVRLFNDRADLRHGRIRELFPVIQ